MHNSNASEYTLFQSFSQSCLLLIDIFNMSICLISSNWLSVLYKNGRRRIWGEFMNSLSCSMCPCFLIIFFKWYTCWQTVYFYSWYLAWRDLPETGWSWKTRHASRLSRNVHLHGVLSEWHNLKGSLMGSVLGVHCALPLHPIPVRVLRMDLTVSHKYQSWPVQ